MWLKKADELILYHGGTLSETLEGWIFLTDSMKDAADYAEVEELSKIISANDDLSNIAYEILGEQGAENFSDLSVDQLEAIIEGNGGTLPENKISVNKVKVNVNNPLDLRELGSDIGDLGAFYNELFKLGLLDESWESLDEYAREEIEDDYKGLSTYTFLEREGIYTAAFQKGYDAVIFKDRGLNALGTHDSWLIKDASKVQII